MTRTRKIDDVLDECLERLLVKNETIEQCLETFPQYSGELKPLLEVALAARQTLSIQPRPEFMEQARQELNLWLQGIGGKKKRVSFSWGWGWQPRWAMALAVVLVFFLIGGTTVAAAAGSMPDSALYPVKRVTEQAQLALTFSELGKAELHTRLADKRVTEIAYLAERGQSDKIARIADRLSAHLSEVSLLVSAPGAMSRLAQPVTQQAAVPEEKLAPLPAAASEKASVAKEELAGKEETLRREYKKETKEERSKGDRRARLKETVGKQADNHIARLRALLESAPESARPGLRRALALSEAEYEKALEALK